MAQQSGVSRLPVMDREDRPGRGPHHLEHETVPVRRQDKAEGAERRRLRESIAALRKSFERANADLATAIEVAETTTMRVPQSGVLEKVARIEAAEKERARWLRAQAALDRERQQRERGAAERERGVR